MHSEHMLVMLMVHFMLIKYDAKNVERRRSDYFYSDLSYL
jgi:hypothetical protein